MKRQRSLDFGARSDWAEIVVADPRIYRGLLYELALRFLHQHGKPHPTEPCPLCAKERAA